MQSKFRMSKDELESMNLHELIGKLAEVYELDSSETAFIEWYANLDKDKREKMLPVLMTCMMDIALEVIQKRK